MPFKDPEARREYSRKYRAKNREKIRDRWRKWRAANAAKVCERNRKWNAANAAKIKESRQRLKTEKPEKIREYNYTYYAKHKEKVAAATNKWRTKNIERARENCRKWNAAHPEKRIEVRQRRRARKLGAVVSDVELEFIWNRDKGICYLCHEPIDPDDCHYDHVVPLSKGGSHSADNLRPTHSKCNMKKGSTLVDVRNTTKWVQLKF